PVCLLIYCSGDCKPRKCSPSFSAAPFSLRPQQPPSPGQRPFPGRSFFCNGCAPAKPYPLPAHSCGFLPLYCFPLRTRSRPWRVHLTLSQVHELSFLPCLFLPIQL